MSACSPAWFPVRNQLHVTEDPFSVMCCSSPVAFKILCLWLLTVWLLCFCGGGGGIFEFILFGFVELLGGVGAYFSSDLGGLGLLFLQNTVSFSFFSFLDSHYLYVVSLMLSHRSLGLFLNLRGFLFLWLDSLEFTSCSACSVGLLSPSSEFFILVLILLNSQIYIWYTSAISSSLLAFFVG